MKRNPKKERSKSIRKSLSFPEDLYNEMLQFKKEKKFGSFSEMIRMGYRVLKKSYESSVGYSQENIFEKLEQIEDRLEELTHEEFQLDTIERELSQNLETIPPDQLDFNFKKIAQEILDVIADPDQYQGQVKDFVIIDHFKSRYSRGIIFYVLTQLKNRKILTLEHGVWKIRND